MALSIFLQNAALMDDDVTFFDFDECSVGPFALDLATMVAWLRSEEDTNALWAALIVGYTSYRPLTSDEVLAFPTLILLSELRLTHVLARFSGMPEAMWFEWRERVGRGISDFRGRDQLGEQALS